MPKQRILIAALAACTFGGLSGAAEAADRQPMRGVDLARLKARTMCSCVFVQQLPLRECADGRSAIWRYTFGATPPELHESADQRLSIELAPSGGSVRFVEREQPLAESLFFDDGGGCVTSEPGKELSFARAKDVERRGSTVALPRAPLPSSAVASAVREALDTGFATDGPLSGYARAALVVLDGSVVAERYAPGFGPEQRYYFGSVAKIFNNLLAGLLVRDGKLRVEERVDWPQWQSPKDPRGGITFDQLLRMTSGLDWSEEFFVPGAPAYEVYFGGSASLDVAGFVGSRSLEAKPGAHFEYSTGASTLLAAALQRRLGERSRAVLLEYLRRELFEPLGAGGVTLEFDAAGSFLAGHSAFSRPDDLARIGLLLLNDGRWDGRQVLPKGWVAHSTRRAQQGAAATSDYGAHLMLDVLGVPGCFGHLGVGGQRLLVCPKRRLVLVWFSSAFDFLRAKRGDPDDALRRLVAAFPER